MSGEPTQAVVRLRWVRGVFTSKLMPLAEAAATAERLRGEVVACGDGVRFVHLIGHDGREVHVRGREVVIVEYVPDLPDRIRPPRQETRQSVVAGVDIRVQGPAPTGTAWLQQVAATHSNGDRR